MPQAVSLLPFLLALLGNTFAGLSIWPSFHVALSSASVFVDFNPPSDGTVVRSSSLSLVDTDTNTTLQTRTLPVNHPASRVEFNCSCFLYAGTFRFLLRQTSVTAVPPANGSRGSSSVESSDVESTAWLWSSELQVQWPTFHISVERARNRSGSFQVGISTNEHFQACSRSTDSALFLEVSYMEYNQIGRNSIDKVRDRKRQPIKPLRSQTVELACAFPFTEKDYIRVALRSPYVTPDIKSSGPLYLSRIFSYKLVVENSNAYRSSCEGTMTVKLITPPCAYINGKVLLYKDPVGGAVSPEEGKALLGFGAEEPASSQLAFKWLTQGENETEFNCSVFDLGRNKYCFRFVFNFSRSPSPARTCLVVHRSPDSWGPWQQWSSCSARCGEGVRERVRGCLLPSGVGGIKCTGMVKEQSICSLEDCAMLPPSSPSLPTTTVGMAPLGGNMMVVLGISLCLAVILATVIVTVWRKFCKTPQCSSAHRGSVHSPTGRKLSDEASIFTHSLQRPSMSESQSPLGGSASIANRDPSVPANQKILSIPVTQDPERLSPTGQKILPTVFGYRLAQHQLKEMKKMGLKEATQMYHVSSSPVNDTLLEISASPTTSPVPTPTGFAHPSTTPQDGADHSQFQLVAPLSKPPPHTTRVTLDRQSPMVEPFSGSSKWHDRTADWVEMVERSRLVAHRGGSDAGAGNSFHRNPNFRRTSSFNDTKPQSYLFGNSTHFRERSMTQVGSRTLPEGSSWSRGGWERLPHRSYPIPEHGIPEWVKSKPQKDHKPWTETAMSPHKSELKQAGTSTVNKPACARNDKTDLSSGTENQRNSESREAHGVSGIGGPAAALTSLTVDRAEQNWYRRGPSPIQRNMLARKLKEAQSCSGVKGRQRSSTFSASSTEQRKGRCRSLPMSEDYISSGSSPYRLSEAEQKMLDLDLSSSFAEEMQ